MKKMIQKTLKGLAVTVGMFVFSYVVCYLSYKLLSAPDITYKQHVYNFYFQIFRVVFFLGIIGSVLVLPIYLIYGLIKKITN